MKNYMKPSDKEETLLCIRLITGYFSKMKANQVAGGFSPPAPTTPCVRIRTGRFIKVTGPWPGSVFSPTVP